LSGLLLNIPWTVSEPSVPAVGPYAYNEYFRKIDIEWTDDGDTVSYNIYKYFVFDQSRTGPGLSESDKLTIPYSSAVGFQWTITSIPIPIDKQEALELLMEVSKRSCCHVCVIDINVSVVGVCVQCVRLLGGSD
jgi:hypothetical protein